jgi:hypothetical protein
MTALLESITSFPTVVFTVLVGVAVVYWLFVIIGALDIHMFDSVEGAFEGAAEGAAEGVAEGVAEGIAEGVAEGIAEGVVEGATEGAHELHFDHHHEGLPTLHAFTGKRRAPMTVMMSLFVLSGWVLSYFAMLLCGPALSAIVPAWVVGTGVLVGASVLSMPIARLVSHPLGPLFVTHEGERLQDLIGKTCIIETGSVDAKFGQALVQEGGAGHKIQVRRDKEPALARGDEALIIGWDPEREAFRVERLRSAPTNEELAQKRAASAQRQGEAK